MPSSRTRGFHGFLRGQAVYGFGFEGLRAEQVHAVIGAGYGEDHHASLRVRGHHARAFGGCIVVGLVLHGKHRQVLVDIGIVAEDAAERSYALFPRGTVETIGGAGLVTDTSGDSLLKSGEVSSSLARTWASVLTRR